MLLSPLRGAAVLAAGLAAGLGAGCGFGGSEAEGSDEPAAAIVELFTVKSELLRDVVTFNGQLSSEKSVVVKAETDGVIREVLFEEGERVEAEAVLYRLRSDEQRARLREAQANLQLAREVYNRTQQLATRNAASEAQKDAAVAELAVARARVELAEVELDRTEVRAPFQGVLGQQLVFPGDRITDDRPLVQLDAVDRLQVAFAITELGILFSRVGAPVEVSVAPYPNEVFKGEVFFVSPTLDPATRRIIAKAWVPNAEHRLRAGLFASVDMEIQQRENAILVPESAVVFDREGAYVWRVDAGDVATRVPVQVGLRKASRVEVTQGLEPGDTVVSAGTHKVMAGSKVAAAAAEGASDQARREPAAAEPAGQGT